MFDENRIEEIKKLWEAESDAYVLRAINDDIAEYDDAVKEVIFKEAYRRGLITEGQKIDSAALVTKAKESQGERILKKSKRRILIGAIFSFFVAFLAYLHSWNIFLNTQLPPNVRVGTYIAEFTFFIPAGVFFSVLGISLTAKSLTLTKVLNLIYWLVMIVLGVISFVVFGILYFRSGEGAVKNYPIMQLVVQGLSVLAFILFYAIPLEIGIKGLKGYIEIVKGDEDIRDTELNR